MRSLVVVATTLGGAVNKFAQASLASALNLKDFLEQTGEYEAVALYELEKSMGPLRQWAQLEERLE
jgi:hypothetical protein